MNNHQMQWTSPSPLWAETAKATEPAVLKTFNQPAILRFTTDSFMDEFMAVLQKDPAQLRGLTVQPETWRGPTPPPKSKSLLEPTEPKSIFARKLERLRLSAERSRDNVIPPAASISNQSNPLSQEGEIKLYQPAHQRYYLVSACLVCRLTGLPDRRLDAGRQERATFVVRRLFPPGTLDPTKALPPFDPDTWEEHALVITPDGGGWQKIPDGQGTSAAVLVPGEEQLPLFAVNFTEDDGRNRRLFAGLVPVGKREAYMGRSQYTPPVQDMLTSPTGAGRIQEVSPTDPRMILFYNKVTEPWKSLIDRAYASFKTNHGDPPSPDQELPGAALLKSVKATREQLQTISWYILLDFVDFLKRYLPNVWKALTTQTLLNPLSAHESALVDALKKTAMKDTSTAKTLATDLINKNYSDFSVIRNLADALVRIGGGLPFDTKRAQEIEALLESASTAYDRDADDATNSWPPFLFPFSDPEFKEDAPLPQLPVDIVPTDTDQDIQHKKVDKLGELVRLAMPVQPPEEKLPAPTLAAQENIDPREGWFVIRCVFEHPKCGLLNPPVVSEPTRAFQLAGFFDPDAPARPIRIALPVDTSPAGLRKFDKNTAFMISDILCGQIKRAKGLGLGDLIRAVLPWPLHKDLSLPDRGPCKSDAGLEMGMICSLSIPIITICALVLLMIIVNLLDIIFRWVPYFSICFPLPGFKGKKS